MRRAPGLGDSPAAWLSALGVFAVFGAISLAFWKWFRFRPAPIEG